MKNIHLLVKVQGFCSLKGLMQENHTFLDVETAVLGGS